jgi:hypothetical protein
MELFHDLPAPFQAAIARLASHPRVAGALLIGSLPAGALSPTSDYDLVLIIDDLEPLWYVGVTTIGGRFADVILVACRALDQIAGRSVPVAHDDALAAPLRWLADGAIILDRDDALGAAQAAARREGLRASPAAAAAYAAWFGLNYNLAVIDRLIQSSDPRILAVAAIRMAVYGHSDLWFGYFSIRRQPWLGDTRALAALQAHDPGYLAGYQQFLLETDHTEKARRYRDLAARAAAPLGGLWPPGWSGENLEQSPLRVSDLLGDAT